MPGQYIKLFVSCLDTWESLSDAECGRLTRALLNYRKSGEAATLTGGEKVLFPTHKAQIDRDTKNYDATCKRNAANGKKGGRPKNPLKPTETHNNPAGFLKTQNNPQKPTESQDSNSYIDNNNLSSLLSQPAVCDDKKSKGKKEFPPKSDPYLAAKYMATKIKKRTPTFPPLNNGKEEETIQRWAADIDKLLRIDKVPFDEFKAVLEFSQNDSFWQKNILSGEKLRKQYGAMLVRMSDDQ